MSLSTVEARELRAFAALMERAETPEVRLANVAWLRVWVDAKTAPRVGAGGEQLELLNDAPTNVADASTDVGDVGDVRHERRARRPSMTKGAIYQRAKRAREKAARDASTTPTTVVDDRRGTRSALLEISSISNSNRSEISPRARETVVDGDPLDRERPEPEALEAAWAVRPDLSEGVIRHSWGRFVDANPSGTEEHWRNWIRGEDETLTGLAPTASTPPSSARRPIAGTRRITRDEDLPPCSIADAMAAVERATGPPRRAPAVA